MYPIPAKTMIIIQAPSTVPVCLPFESSHVQSSYVWQVFLIISQICFRYLTLLHFVLQVNGILWRVTSCVNLHLSPVVVLDIKPKHFCYLTLRQWEYQIEKQNQRKSESAIAANKRKRVPKPPVGFNAVIQYTVCPTLLVDWVEHRISPSTYNYLIMVIVNCGPPEVLPMQLFQADYCVIFSYMVQQECSRFDCGRCKFSISQCHFAQQSN